MNAPLPPATVFRHDYQPPAWWVDRVELAIDLDPEQTRTHARLSIRPNRTVNPTGTAPLVLHGDELTLTALTVDGVPLAASAYRPVGGDLILTLPTTSAAERLIEVSTLISPATNSKLMGLYTSRGGFFTQCEAEGFRRIVYFPDRPDVMARYRVTLTANAETTPVLLSNGNLLSSEELSDGRLRVVWDDPFPKPSYLFALVAARLVCRQQIITTRSGRPVTLQIWVDEAEHAQTEHALTSLINAIRWDEQRFGLELDLDRFMVVGVADFNSGAMENKGLNLFNNKLLLASPETATDLDYDNVESVIAHEYFHNWTGNRVTCRDWFQLTLKEGLTVYRDQEFSADMAAAALSDGQNDAAAQSAAVASARAIRRIDAVRMLRATQFAEDDGPMAHPIRPDEYEEIRNFYTATVYEKGAEVIRMLATLVGDDGFARGMALYFERHDGSAVTCDDFVSAIADANGIDARVFMRWYSQRGTPRLSAVGHYDTNTQTYTLTLAQRPPVDWRGQPTYREPLHLPIKLGLIDRHGNDIALTLQHADGSLSPLPTPMVELKTDEASFVFAKVDSPPVLSLLRGFSAPVLIESDESDTDLAFRLRVDSDPFNRWDAGQRYFERTLLRLANDIGHGGDVHLPSHFLTVWQSLMTSDSLAPGYLAQLLSLPSELYLLQRQHLADAAALRQALMLTMQQLGQHFAAQWRTLFDAQRVSGPYRFHPIDAGRRSLSLLALRYLLAGDAAAHQELALDVLHSANNLTETHGALAALVQSTASGRDEALAAFYQRYAHDALVLDKWFFVQASAWRWQAASEPTREAVKRLLDHPAFNLHNPNKVYALLGGFFRSNPAEFHQPASYAFWAEMIIGLDAINSQVASRMARPMERWRNMHPSLHAAAKDALTRVANSPNLSADVAEIVGKALTD